MQQAEDSDAGLAAVRTVDSISGWITLTRFFVVILLIFCFDKIYRISQKDTSLQGHINLQE